MRAHLLAIVLLAGSPVVARGQAVSLDDALAGAADALKQSKVIDPETGAPMPQSPEAGAAAAKDATGPSAQPTGADLAAVKTLLAAGGNGRVSDTQADLVAKRLAKVRDDAADRRGKEDTKTLLAACDTDGDGKVSLPEARAAVARVGFHRLPDEGENGQRVARNPVVGPARVVELLDLALADAGLLPLELQRSFVL